MVCSCFITSLLVMETRDKENNISSAAGWELLDSFSSFTKLGNRPASLNCVWQLSFPRRFLPLLKKKSKMGRHFVFAHVVSQRNDEVLCALMDFSTAERAAVEQSNYCAVKEVRVPKYNRTWSILQGQCGVPSSAVTLVLNQSWVKCYQSTCLNHSYSPFQCGGLTQRVRSSQEGFICTFNILMDKKKKKKAETGN